MTRVARSMRRKNMKLLYGTFYPVYKRGDRCEGDLPKGFPVDWKYMAYLLDRLCWKKNIRFSDFVIPEYGVMFRGGIAAPRDADKSAGMEFSPSHPVLDIWGRYADDTGRCRFEPFLYPCEQFEVKGEIDFDDLKNEFPRGGADVGHGLKDRD